MKYHKPSFFLLSFLIFATSLCQEKKGYVFSGGTTIITVLTKDTVWIAADTKRTNGSRLHRLPPSKTAKIKGNGKIFYSITSDFATITDPKNNIVFDAYRLMDSMLTKYKTIEKAVDGFSKEAVIRLNWLLGIMPPELSNDMKSKDSIIQMEVITVTFRNARPVSLICQLGVKHFSDGPRFISLILNNDRSLPFVHFAGVKEEISAITNDPNYYWSTDIKSNLIDLIKIEAKLHPDKVGEPIDVIKIYQNGYKWLTNNHH